MPYVRGTFTGERARRLARQGSLTGKSLRPKPWWPEEICEKIDRIVWQVYCLGETGDDWHEFTAFDAHGKVVAVRRTEGY